MRTIFLYGHGGSGNHGCEAIVRSTLSLLEDQNVTLFSSRPEEDEMYGVSKLCKVIKETDDHFSKANYDFVKAYLSLKINKNSDPMDKMRYRSAFSSVEKNDIALSIGGDNYCYADVGKYIMLHNMMIERGAKTVLWGCSVEPEVAKRPDVKADLARYDLITARERITYEALKQINPNTILAADTAFLLNKKEIPLPEQFLVGQTVGINLSPMAIENERVKGITWRNYQVLIESILSNTEMNVALIPHVVWERGDDRLPLRSLYAKFEDTNRVCMIEDRPCEELKYAISQCRFFVGARTHATIAAYSSGVPTLVLGYSVKSRGIARDLFGTENGFVIPVQRLSSEYEIAEAFMWIVENELSIQNVLTTAISQYPESMKHLCELL